jgi:hypothetical protein
MKTYKFRAGFTSAAEPGAGARPRLMKTYKFRAGFASAAEPGAGAKPG